MNITNGLSLIALFLSLWGLYRSYINTKAGVDMQARYDYLFWKLQKLHHLFDGIELLLSPQEMQDISRNSEYFYFHFTRLQKLYTNCTYCVFLYTKERQAAIESVGIQMKQMLDEIREATHRKHSLDQARMPEEKFLRADIFFSINNTIIEKSTTLIKNLMAYTKEEIEETHKHFERIKN